MKRSSKNGSRIQLSNVLKIVSMWNELLLSCRVFALILHVHANIGADTAGNGPTKGPKSETRWKAQMVLESAPHRATFSAPRSLPVFVLVRRPGLLSSIYNRNGGGGVGCRRIFREKSSFGAIVRQISANAH